MFMTHIFFHLLVLQFSLHKGIINLKTFWQFILPTWEFTIKSKKNYLQQNKYIDNIRRSGSNIRDIQINTQLEIEIFLETISLLFQVKIYIFSTIQHLNFNNKIIDKYATNFTFYISFRLSQSTTIITEAWISNEQREVGIQKVQKQILPLENFMSYKCCCHKHTNH